MKKLIQICSMLSLVVFFSIVSAQAQVVKKYAAEIPFDFNIGQKSYPAGDYTIKISKISLSTVSLALEDKEKNLLRTVLIRGNGNVSKNEEKLVFVRDGNRRFLSEMLTEEMELSFASSNEMKRSLKAKGEPERETQHVAMALK